MYNDLSVITQQNAIFRQLFLSFAFRFQKGEGDDKDKKKEIVVLEMKRSQAINIGLTKLPPIRALKQAILNMDSAVIDREGIDVSMTQAMISYKKLFFPLHRVDAGKYPSKVATKYSHPLERCSSKGGDGK